MNPRFFSSTGPSSWPGDCNEKAQSPIDIPKSGNKILTAKPFMFVNYDSTPETSTLINKDTAVQLEMKPVKPEMAPSVR